jgi:hypothetical protein
MVDVANYPDLASAQVAQSLLESADIMSFIPDEAMVGIDWRWATALQGIRLQVSSEDADEARALLADLGPIEAEPPAAENEDEICPSCGGVVAEASWKRRWKVISMFFPWMLLLWPLASITRPALTCRACGQGYRSV